MKVLSKKQKINIAIAVSVIAIVVILASTLGWYYGVFTNPYYGTTVKYKEPLNFNEILSEKQAKADLNYVIGRLRDKHPAWLEDDNDLAERAEEIYASEFSKISGQQTVLNVWRATSKICAVLSDAHTGTRYFKNYKFINDFSGVQVNGYPVSIDGVNTAELYERSKSLYSYETEKYLENNFYTSYLYNDANLALMGINTDDGVDFLFENGVEIHYNFVDADKVTGTNSSPSDSKWVSYDIDETRNIGIFTLKNCVANDEYKSVVAEFFKEVNAKGIDNIAVDLRNNGGGNSAVADIFVTYLNVDNYKTWSGYKRKGNKLVSFDSDTVTVDKKSDAFGGKIFVLTSVNTFSSAMDFAMIISDNGIGEIVGEASGNLPDCYIDALGFQLPHSRLSLNVSWKRNFRIDRSKSGQPINPDYPCSSRYALDKVYELIGA